MMVDKWGEQDDEDAAGPPPAAPGPGEADVPAAAETLVPAATEAAPVPALTEAAPVPAPTEAAPVPAPTEPAPLPPTEPAPVPDEPPFAYPDPEAAEALVATATEAPVPEPTEAPVLCDEDVYTAEIGVEPAPAPTSPAPIALAVEPNPGAPSPSSVTAAADLDQAGASDPAGSGGPDADFDDGQLLQVLQETSFCSDQEQQEALEAGGERLAEVPATEPACVALSEPEPDKPASEAPPSAPPLRAVAVKLPAPAGTITSDREKKESLREKAKRLNMLRTHGCMLSAYMHIFTGCSGHAAHAAHAGDTCRIALAEKVARRKAAQAASCPPPGPASCEFVCKNTVAVHPYMHAYTALPFWDITCMHASEALLVTPPLLTPWPMMLMKWQTALRVCLQQRLQQHLP